MPATFPLTFPIIFSGTSTPFDVAGDIVNDAAIQLGIGNSPDPFGSTDPNFIQLCSLLKNVGRELRKKKEWTDLTQFYAFTTVAGQGTYPLPDGFGRVINSTVWNLTNQLPVPGPLTAQEWSYLKARLVGVVYNVLFRPVQQQLYLFPDSPNTPGGWVIAYEFTSRFWVMSVAASAPDKSAPDANDDVVWFDPLLVLKALKLEFKRAHKMDTASAQDEFDVALNDAMDDDGGAPVLNLTLGGGGNGELLGQRNVPLTGFGGV